MCGGDDFFFDDCHEDLRREIRALRDRSWETENAIEYLQAGFNALAASAISVTDVLMVADSPINGCVSFLSAGPTVAQNVADNLSFGLEYGPPGAW